MLCSSVGQRQQQPLQTPLITVYSCSWWFLQIVCPYYLKWTNVRLFRFSLIEMKLNALNNCVHLRPFPLAPRNRITPPIESNKVKITRWLLPVLILIIVWILSSPVTLNTNQSSFVLDLFLTQENYKYTDSIWSHVYKLLQVSLKPLGNHWKYERNEKSSTKWTDNDCREGFGNVSSLHFSQSVQCTVKN